MMRYVRSKLSRRLFLSYLAVAAAGIGVLALSSELNVPQAFSRHLAMMAEQSGGALMIADLYQNFQSAFSEALIIGLLTSAVIAIVASLWFGRRVTVPLLRLKDATQRIADGHYDERVPAPPAPEGDELADLARSFNRMTQAIGGAEMLRRELVTNVAHELRTPLATIKGNLEALLDGVLPPEPATFQLLYREAGRLQTLVDDLMELSRVEAGVYVVDRQLVAPADLALAAVERLALQFQDKGVSLHNEVRDDLPKVSVDPDRIGQVLLNLVGNALQYTPAGGHVTLTGRQVGNRLELAVTDSGAGIAPEHLPHIFERFYRVDRSRSRAGGGTGIGLTIARLLAEAHGGTVRAESAGVGQGSTFIVELPI